MKGWRAHAIGRMTNRMAKVILGVVGLGGGIVIAATSVSNGSQLEESIQGVELWTGVANPSNELQLGHAASVVDLGLVASAQEQATVAELMKSSESPTARPPLYVPRASAQMVVYGIRL